MLVFGRLPVIFGVFTVLCSSLEDFTGPSGLLLSTLEYPVAQHSRLPREIFYLLGGFTEMAGVYTASLKIALFDNDSGVQDKLEDFKRLVIQQGQISDAITLEHVLRSEQELTGSVRKLLETLEQDSESSGRLLEAKSQEILDEIAETRLALRTVDARTEALQKDADDRKGERKQQELFSQACKKLSIDRESIQNLAKDFDQMRGD